MGGLRKEKRREAETIDGCYQNSFPYIRMYLGESSLCFFSVAAFQALLQLVNGFLNA